MQIGSFSHVRISSRRDIAKKSSATFFLKLSISININATSAALSRLIIGANSVAYKNLEYFICSNRERSVAGELRGDGNKACLT